MLLTLQGKLCSKKQKYVKYMTIFIGRKALKRILMIKIYLVSLIAAEKITLPHTERQLSPKALTIDQVTYMNVKIFTKMSNFPF